MPAGRPLAHVLAGVSVGALLLSSCTGEPEPDIEDLGRTLSRDGKALLKEAKVMAPVNYDGRITFLDRPGTRNIACAEDGSVKRVFEGHGVGEYGSPARLPITTQTLAGILRPQDYEVDRYSEKPRRFRLWLSKADGDLSFRVVVDDGAPMRWRAVGETRCLPSS